MSELRMTVHCPECDCDDLREKNVAYTTLRVWEWDVDSDGIPQPVDCDADADPEWEVQDVAKQYVCHGCHGEFSLDQLTVKNPRTSHPTGEL